jgi:hypothetical protein
MAHLKEMSSAETRLLHDLGETWTSYPGVRPDGKRRASRHSGRVPGRLRRERLQRSFGPNPGRSANSRFLSTIASITHRSASRFASSCDRYRYTPFGAVRGAAIAISWLAATSASDGPFGPGSGILRFPTTRMGFPNFEMAPVVTIGNRSKTRKRSFRGRVNALCSARTSPGCRSAGSRYVISTICGGNKGHVMPCAAAGDGGVFCVQEWPPGR